MISQLKELCCKGKHILPSYYYKIVLNWYIYLKKYSKTNLIRIGNLLRS